MNSTLRRVDDARNEATFHDKGKPVRFLVVEDDPGHATLIGRVLQSLFPGCTVDCEEDVAGVFSDCHGGDYKAVIADLSLPDAQGMETVRILNNYLPTLPMIVLTSLADEEMALGALEHGAQDYLSKQDILTTGPIGGDKLRRAIRYAIQRQEARKENQLLVMQLTESKKLLEAKNRRLEQLCDTSQRFVDNVSHEFRTPLTVIKEYCSLIRDGVVGPVNDGQVQMLNVIDDRTDDLNNMVDDMLDISRLEAGLLGLCRQEHKLHEIVHYLMPGLRRKAVIRKVKLDIDIPDSLPTVWCDDEKIGRVIINLAVNAIKFSGDPGRVRIWAERDDKRHEVVVGVADNGPGIPADKLKEIFKRFEQSITSVRQSTKGFGLGLGIAKELVDLNLGGMNVESAPGQGSTFTFTIPYAEHEEVLRRQLVELREAKPASAEICAVTVEAPNCTKQRDLIDLGLLLQQGLRCHDQIFRAADNRWLIVLAMSPLEFSAFTARLQNDHQEVCRNRPQGNLPEFQVTYRGGWRLDGCGNEEVLLALEQYFAEEVIHA